MKTLIKNGRIITAVDDYRADILIEDEIAVSVARVLASANRKAKELGVDVQTSLITARAAFGKRRLAVARACAAREITTVGAAAD